MAHKLGSFSFDVISRILGILGSGNEMRITNLAIETKMSYYGCIRYVSLLETLGWIKRAKIDGRPRNRRVTEFSYSAIAISDNGLEILARIGPLATRNATKPWRNAQPPSKSSDSIAEIMGAGQRVAPEQMLAAPDDGESPGEQFAAIKPLRLLLVDDERDVLFTYESVLKSHGHKVDAFADPATALSHFIQKGSGSYDIVLLDIRMPKINGIQLFRSVRAIDSEIKIVFLTSLDMSPELSAVTDQLGANRLIRKPVTNEEFLKEIEALCVSP